MAAARAKTPPAKEARSRRRAQRTTIFAASGADADKTALPSDGIARLVAEARERVLVMARKTGGGLAQPTVLGRLAATGEISRRQVEAGRRYAAIAREHDALLGRSGDDAEARSRYRAAMARYDRCRAALRDAGAEDAMAGAVVDAVAVNDWTLPDLTPALRIGLNHLARALDAMGGEATVTAGWFLPAE
ncbi:MAG: hypothetical protein IT534_08495 [Bauldia sp.]|nr:hypothetical protein [Bauldia sp.]